MFRTQVRGIDAAKAFARRLASIPEELPAKLGEVVEGQVRERIDVEKRTPSGAKWAPRLPDSVRRAKGRDLLEKSGRLIASITARAQGAGVAIGSDLLYAARQNRRRPFLGLSSQNIADIRAAVLADVEAAL